MNTPFRLSFALLLAGAAALCAAAPARAVPIAGGSSLDIAGAVSPIGSGNVYDATGVDFRTAGSASIGTPGSVQIGGGNTGSFAGFNAFACPDYLSGGCGSIVDLLSYDGGTGTLNTPALPVAGFLTVNLGGVSAAFDLTSFLVDQTAPGGGSLGTLTLAGYGVLHLTGYDDTPAAITITAQGPGTTTFSGTVIARPAVPEPASLAVLGAGLLALGLVRRRRG